MEKKTSRDWRNGPILRFKIKRKKEKVYRPDTKDWTLVNPYEIQKLTQKDLVNPTKYKKKLTQKCLLKPTIHKN